MNSCDSCGAADDDLAAVRRVYLDPDRLDDPDAATVVAAVEWWCFPCRTLYPHEAA